MNCKKEFNNDFISSNCTNIFITKSLNVHREDILLDREKGLLIETQPYVIRAKEIRKLEKEVREIEKQKNEFRRQIALLDNQSGRIYNQINRLTHAGNNIIDEIEEGKVKYIRKCPIKDCRGFLDTHWKCGVCDSKICSKCNEEKLDSHECIPDSVASMELLKKDSKPCPECGEVIFKISGCFAKDTPILLWDGTTKMSQDIIIGDQLIGDDGNKRSVLKICDGIDELYRVDQNNGMSYTVNSKHTLLLKPGDNNSIFNHSNYYKVKWFNHSEMVYHTKNFNFVEDNKEEVYNHAVLFSKNLKIPETFEIKVDDYIKLPDTIKSKLYGFKGTGINWEHRDVKIDPYLLGLWLGDGNSNGTGFASNDDEITKYFMDYAKKNKLFIVHQDKYFFKINSFLTNRKPIGYEENCKACIKKECGLCSIINENPLINNSRTSVKKGEYTNSFRNLLNDYNLINNKHIPEDYLNNSRENRLKLLAGIIDTDGSVCNNGKRIVISQVNPVFSEQIIILAKSLGFIVNHRIVKRLQVSFPTTDKLSDCKDQYHINISGIHANEIPTILPRKKCASSCPNKNYKISNITVTAVGPGEYFGFMIDQNNYFVSPDLTCLKNCNQMFCVSCKTPWNWATGKKESGVIHNPHYYEYLNQGGRNLNGDHRNAGDIPCGGLPDAYEFRQSISFYNKSSELKKYNIAFENLHRNTSHILNYELRQLQVIDPVIKNRDLRVKYLLNELTEDQFKHELQLSEKKCQKVIAYRNIYQMFVDVSSDNLRQIVIFNRTHPDFQVAENFFKEQIEIYNGLVTYFNQSLEKVGKMYKCVYPAIMPDTFNLINNISSHNKEIKRRDAQREQARMLGNNV